MRLWLLALLLTVTAAQAQTRESDPIIATPLPPADATPPPIPPAPIAPAPTPEAGWLPRGTAQVQALDKVNARGTMLTIKVGQSTTYASLTIAVRACVVRPPDAAADAAAFLTVTDANPNGPGFSGWKLRSIPSVSMLEHPIYDLRVVGCGV